MTPKARANLSYYWGVALCIAGGIVLGIERALHTGLLSVAGVMLIVSFMAISVFHLATSRCPRCRRFIDLRGRSAYCPRSGDWIPATEGEQPPAARW
jgi:hypothetical protein